MTSSRRRHNPIKTSLREPGAERACVPACLRACVRHTMAESPHHALPCQGKKGDVLGRGKPHGSPSSDRSGAQGHVAAAAASDAAGARAGTAGTLADAGAGAGSCPPAQRLAANHQPTPAKPELQRRTKPRQTTPLRLLWLFALLSILFWIFISSQSRSLPLAIPPSPTPETPEPPKMSTERT